MASSDRRHTAATMALLSQEDVERHVHLERRNGPKDDPTCEVCGTRMAPAWWELRYESGSRRRLCCAPCYTAGGVPFEWVESL